MNQIEMFSRVKIGWFGLENVNPALGPTPPPCRWYESTKVLNAASKALSFVGLVSLCASQSLSFKNTFQLLGIGSLAASIFFQVLPESDHCPLRQYEILKTKIENQFWDGYIRQALDAVEEIKRFSHRQIEGEGEVERRERLERENE